MVHNNYISLIGVQSHNVFPLVRIQIIFLHLSITYIKNSLQIRPGKE